MCYVMVLCIEKECNKWDWQQLAKLRQVSCYTPHPTLPTQKNMFTESCTPNAMAELQASWMARLKPTKSKGFHWPTILQFQPTQTWHTVHSPQIWDLKSVNLTEKPCIFYSRCCHPQNQHKGFVVHAVLSGISCWYGSCFDCHFFDESTTIKGCGALPQWAYPLHSAK